jgi:predicted metal-dependent hydrolase
MSEKSERIARLVREAPGGGLDPYYLGYFEQFNRGLFYEAHDVLEQLWLKNRGGPDGSFYKGLIQLAGAFVHLRRERLRPAAALFKLAEANLRKYPPRHQHLAMPAVLGLIQHWLGRVEQSNFTANPLHSEARPVLRLDG